jgi:hypothetical protein
MADFDNNSNNTPAFNFLAWVSFAVSSVGTLAGLFFLPGDIWMKSFLAMGYLFSLTSCFTVAKIVRDQHEEKKLINRIKDAKTEKLLKDYDLK